MDEAWAAGYEEGFKDGYDQRMIDELPKMLLLQGKKPAVAWRGERWLFQVKLENGTLYNWWCTHIDLAEAIRLWNKHIIDLSK